MMVNMITRLVMMVIMSILSHCTTNHTIHNDFLQCYLHFFQLTKNFEKFYIYKESIFFF